MQISDEKHEYYRKRCQYNLRYGEVSNWTATSKQRVLWLACEILVLLYITKQMVNNANETNRLPNEEVKM